VSNSFQILIPGQGGPTSREAFERQALPATLGNHKASAPKFQPSDELVIAVNAALAVGAPLLITGEPGTGKTQVAYWVAHHFDVEDRLFVFNVRSTSVWNDLLYTFDTVAYFHAAHDPSRQGKPIARAEFVREGPLWKALRSERSIVLIDEIDKASRDFPNDLLHVLEQHSFSVAETGETIARRQGSPPPLVIITSNSERRLPEPFLRRCIFHHIELTEELIRKAVAARSGDFPHLDDETKNAAIGRFLELRGRELRKRPATSELLVWLTLLSARGTKAQDIKHAPLRSLPALFALIKDRDDLAQL
jgi:MoxR-like ATPase